MHQHLGAVTFLVKDYDEAIAFFVGKMGFDLVEDADLGDGKRWVLVCPPGAEEMRLLLAKAATPVQQAKIGSQAGGRVFLFLYTDDFQRDYKRMRENGIHFMEMPRDEPYGTVAVFEDLYGQKWDLIELNSGLKRFP